VEPARAPEVAPVVVFVSGDLRYALSHTTQSRKSHFHHRLEILDGRVAGWVDYTNPLTDSDRSPPEEDTSAPLPASAADCPPNRGDGCPESKEAIDRLEVVPASLVSRPGSPQERRSRPPCRYAQHRQGDHAHQLDH
jgi:hypothetical protein